MKLKTLLAALLVALAAPASASALATAFINTQTYAEGIHVGNSSISMHGGCSFGSNNSVPTMFLHCTNDLQCKTCSICTYSFLSPAHDEVTIEVHGSWNLIAYVDSNPAWSCAPWGHYYAYRIYVTAYEGQQAISSIIGQGIKPPVGGSC